MGEQLVRLGMVERVELANRLVAAREKVKPDSWPVIAKREGVPDRTIRRIYAEVVEERRKLNDPTGQAVVEETLLLLEEMIQATAEIIDDEDAPMSARLSAHRLLQEILEERFSVLVASGRMPRNLAAANDLAQAKILVRHVIEALERRGAAPELLMELAALIEDPKTGALQTAT